MLDRSAPAESEAHREPAAAPHVRPPGGDGVGVALTADRTTRSDALDYLFARTTGGFKFGLERTARSSSISGNPHRAYPSIHVAGTNGKGSSVATMSDALDGEGSSRRDVHVAPSRRFSRAHDRWRRRRFPPTTSSTSSTRHMPVIEEIGASFFEATTAMAFEYFARAGADVAVIEAGLGGRLDSTNVLTPLVAGVTSIGFDHTEYLGVDARGDRARESRHLQAGRGGGDRRARSRAFAQLLAEPRARAWRDDAFASSPTRFTLDRRPRRRRRARAASSAGMANA